MAGLIDSMRPTSRVATVQAGTALEANALGLSPTLFNLRARPLDHWARAARAELALALRMKRLEGRLRSLR